MKIKITQPGFESFTGHFGVVEFVDGVSVDEVTQREADVVSSLIAVETLEGKNPSPAQRIIDGYAGTMALASLPTADQAPAQAPVAPDRRYTAEELAVIADEKGIKGLREIAEPLGLKANSIAELIGKILAAAGDSTERAAEQGAATGDESAEDTAAAQAQVDQAVGQ